MTDARLADSFLTNAKVDGLTDGAFRGYVNGIVWSVQQGTDGLLPARALRYLHPDGARPELTRELVDAGLWEPADDGAVRIHDFLDYQTPAAQVERARELARIRKRKQRESELNGETTEETDEPSNDVTRDVLRDGHRDGRRDLQGQDRQGKDALREKDQSGSVTADRDDTDDEPWDPPGEYMGGPVDWKTGHPLHAVQDRA